MAMACAQVRFEIEPTDEVLVGHYLLRKSTGKPLWAEGAVTERDTYGDEKPWEIFGYGSGDGGSEEENAARYFFTNLTKKIKYMNPKSSARAVRKRKGSWKGVGNGQPILNWVKAVIGWKRSFIYADGNATLHHGQWIMEEYSIAGVLLDHMKKVTHGKYDDYVLCRITSKGIMKQAGRCINTVNSMDDDIVAAQFVRTDMAIEPTGCSNYEPNLEQAPVNNVAAAAAMVAQSNQISESCIVRGSPEEGTMLGSSSTLATGPPPGEAAAAAQPAIREESESFTWIGNEVEAQEQNKKQLLGTSSTLINGSELESSMIVNGCNKEAWTWGIDDIMGLDDPGTDNIICLEDPYDDSEFKWMLANCDMVI